MIGPAKVLDAEERISKSASEAIAAKLAALDWRVREIEAQPGIGLRTVEVSVNVPEESLPAIRFVVRGQLSEETAIVWAVSHFAGLAVDFMQWDRLDDYLAEAGEEDPAALALEWETMGECRRALNRVGLSDGDIRGIVAATAWPDERADRLTESVRQHATTA